METSRSVPETEPTGWAIFAGFVLLVVGSLDALWGLAAILEDKNVIVGGNGVIISSATTWGWVYLILGLLVAATGVGLFAGNETALGRGLLRLPQRDRADRLVPRRTAVAVPDHHPRRADHPRADGGLGGDLTASEGRPHQRCGRPAVAGASRT
jgi:hypothetical protein